MDDLIIVDLETTGTNPQLDKIIEIGALKIRDDEVIEEFSSFVDPDRKLSQDVKNITGIKDKDLETAPPIEEVLEEFSNFREKLPLMAHNMDFDQSFFEKNDIEGKFLDSLNLACLLLPIEKKHTQEYLLESCCDITYDAHRAMEDVKNLYKLYQFLLARVEEVDERLRKEFKEALKNSNWEFKELFQKKGGKDDSYITKAAEEAEYCPKQLPENSSGLPLAHLLSWLFYTETGNKNEISYWVRRKYEDFFRNIAIQKCKGKCNYFNNNERLF